MKTFFSYSSILIFQLSLLFLVGCGDEEAPLPENILSSNVSSVTPMVGYVGDDITIKGIAINDCIIIEVGDLEILPTIVNNNEVHFKIPSEATSGDVVITFNDGRQLITQNVGFFKVLESAKEVLQDGVQNMKCFDFSSELIGYYTAGDRVMKTSDGGQNWLQVLNEVNSHPLYAVSESKVWIDQNFGKPIKSDDGGNSWKKVDFNRENATVDYLALSQEMAFAIVSDNSDNESELLYSKNDGTTWDVLNHEVLQNKLVDSRIVYQNGENLMLYNTKLNQFVSSRNLVNWEVVAVESTLTNESANSIHFIDMNRGWMSVEGGVAYTSNGGGQWDKIAVKLFDRNASIVKVHFFNEYDGMMISSDGGVSRTADGGLHWKTRYVNGRFLEADFVDGKRAAIVSFNDGASNYTQLLKLNF